jgi:hypothetical protein
VHRENVVNRSDEREIGVLARCRRTTPCRQKPHPMSLDSWNLMSSSAARDKIVQRMIRVAGQVSGSCRTRGEDTVLAIPLSCDLARAKPLDTCVTHNVPGLDSDTLELCERRPQAVAVQHT